MLSETVMHSGPFAILATFVAINTMMYAALTAAKLLPKFYLSDIPFRRKQRLDNRSIYPTSPELVATVHSAGAGVPFFAGQPSAADHGSLG
jgi:hypothetical protein